MRFRRDAGDAPDRLRRFEERRVIFGGEIFEPIQRNAPDAARREINDAAERNDVVRVVNQLQVSAKVLHFLAVEELESANELERDAVPLQGVFEVSRERVHSVKNGVIARAALAGRDLGGDLRGDRLRLFLLVETLQNARGDAFVALGVKVFVLAEKVVLDERVGDPKNALVAAVILLEPNDFRVFEILFEIQNVLDVRAAPTVNRLVGVAGNGKVSDCVDPAILDINCPQ